MKFEGRLTWDPSGRSFRVAPEDGSESVVGSFTIVKEQLRDGDLVAGTFRKDSSQSPSQAANVFRVGSPKERALPDVFKDAHSWVGRIKKAVADAGASAYPLRPKQLLPAVGEGWATEGEGGFVLLPARGPPVPVRVPADPAGGLTPNFLRRLLHHTKKTLELVGETPDLLLSCLSAMPLGYRRGALKEKDLLLSALCEKFAAKDPRLPELAAAYRRRSLAHRAQLSAALAVPAKRRKEAEPALSREGQTLLLDFCGVMQSCLTAMGLSLSELAAEMGERLGKAASMASDEGGGDDGLLSRSLSASPPPLSPSPHTAGDDQERLPLAFVNDALMPLSPPPLHRSSSPRPRQASHPEAFEPLMVLISECCPQDHNKLVKELAWRPEGDVASPAALLNAALQAAEDLCLPELMDFGRRLTFQLGLKRSCEWQPSPPVLAPQVLLQLPPLCDPGLRGRLQDLLLQLLDEPDPVDCGGECGQGERCSGELSTQTVLGEPRPELLLLALPECGPQLSLWDGEEEGGALDVAGQAYRLCRLVLPEGEGGWASCSGERLCWASPLFDVPKPLPTPCFALLEKQA